MDRCLAGKAKPDDIGAYVERWHTQKPKAPLHEYLGLTWKEYAAWVDDSSVLEGLIAARRSRRLRSSKAA